MKHRQVDPFSTLVESFFQDYLQRVRGASPHTIRAYRDSLRALFLFLADYGGKTVADLTLCDLNVENVLAFLSHLEAHRNNSPTTRNCRLAAIRGLLKHLLRHDPTHAEQYARVLALPFKNERASSPTYLEPEEVRTLLEQLDRKSRSGMRDYALLLFLYNTGARVSEALNVRVCDITFTRPYVVRLTGKGGKERFCPLWHEVVGAIRRLLTIQSPAPDEHLFRNARGERLTRDGVAYILNKYAAQASKHQPALARRRITPHVLRHSCAVALLQSGVDITVIRDYLGHASVSTTNRYIATNLQMKREALEAFWQRAGLAPSRSRPWRPNPDLLAFLESL